MTRAQKLNLANANVANQRAWIAQCGGDLAGYIAHYGSVDDPEHYGDGGEAIYRADMAALADCIVGLVRLTLTQRAAR